MRFATAEDLPAVVEMIRSFLAEQEEHGSPVPLTARNLDFYRTLAHTYLHGIRFGVVVIDEDGLAMAGEDAPSRFETNPGGKAATVWMVWDENGRKARKALEMLRFGRPRLLELGFDRAVMGVLEGNAAGQALTLSYGARLVERLYEYPLKEEPRGEATG